MPYDEEIDYEAIIKAYKDIGIGIIYEMNSDEEIDATSLMNDLTLLVSKEFIKNNQNNQISFDKMNIKLIVKNKED